MGDEYKAIPSSKIDLTVIKEIETAMLLNSGWKLDRTFHNQLMFNYPDHVVYPRDMCDFIFLIEESFVYVVFYGRIDDAVLHFIKAELSSRGIEIDFEEL